jgi:Holliday junction resolvase
MIKDEKIEMPVDAARLIQDVLAELGWSADPAEVARSVRRLDIGLPAEDEFSVVCAWLGNCELLHKLDQQQVPVASRAKFQVPDLLARFTTQTNSVPVLIEVKSKQGNTLSFQPDYLERLIKYSELVGMPLLIAWKYHSLWMLFEVKHLRKAKKNFNIALSAAARENLLGMLAGDVAYKIGAGAGIHLRFRKDRLISIEKSGEGWTERWQMTIDDVAFSNYDGTRLTDLGTDVQSLFTAWDLEDHEEHTESHIFQRFIAGHEGMQFAHTALVRLLNWASPGADRPHWRSLLRKEQVVANVANFSAALENAFRQKIVSHIFHFQPHAVPDFLPAVRRGAAE